MAQVPGTFMGSALDSRKGGWPPRGCCLETGNAEKPPLGCWEAGGGELRTEPGVQEHSGARGSQVQGVRRRMLPTGKRALGMPSPSSAGSRSVEEMNATRQGGGRAQLASLQARAARPGRGREARLHRAPRRCQGRPAAAATSPSASPGGTVRGLRSESRRRATWCGFGVTRSSDCEKLPHGGLGTER